MTNLFLTNITLNLFYNTTLIFMNLNNNKLNNNVSNINMSNNKLNNNVSNINMSNNKLNNNNNNLSINHLNNNNFDINYNIYIQPFHQQIGIDTSLSNPIPKILFFDYEKFKSKLYAIENDNNDITELLTESLNCELDKFKLIILYIKEKNININVEKILRDNFFKNVIIETFLEKHYIIFEYAINNKLIDKSSIDWFNTKYGNDLILNHSRDIIYNKYETINFIDYLVRNGINTYNFTQFIKHLCDAYINNHISFRETYTKILMHIINNHEFIIDEEYINELLNSMDKNMELYEILSKISLNSNTKSASKCL